MKGLTLTGLTLRLYDDNDELGINFCQWAANFDVFHIDVGGKL